MVNGSRPGPRLVAHVSDDSLLVVQRGVTTICDKRHTDVPRSITFLPANQKGRLRHVCAGCAYKQGYADALAAARDNPDLLKEEEEPDDTRENNRRR